MLGVYFGVWVEFRNHVRTMLDIIGTCKSYFDKPGYVDKMFFRGTIEGNDKDITKLIIATLRPCSASFSSTQPTNVSVKKSIIITANIPIFNSNLSFQNTRNII